MAPGLPISISAMQSLLQRTASPLAFHSPGEAGSVTKSIPTISPAKELHSPSNPNRLLSAERQEP